MKQTVAALVTPYRTFLGLPDIPAMIATAWLSRMPIGMNALAMLLFLRETLGNFKVAGYIVGTFFVAMAVAAPILGRLIDRIGPSAPLTVTGILHPLSLIGLFVATIHGASVPELVAIAAACGIFAPPVTILTRTTWRHRFTDDHNRKMAYSIDSIMIEINFTVGPLLVAAIVASANARVAMATVIGVSAAAVVIFFASPILKYWQREAPVERHLLGPLTDFRLVALFFLTFGLTFCFGARAAFSAACEVATLALMTLDDEQALWGQGDAQAQQHNTLALRCPEVVVKRGALPTLVRLAGQAVQSVATERVERLVDTTAAGDSFAGAYLAARLSGSAAADAAAAGNRLAARVVQHRGAVLPLEAMADLLVSG